MKFSIITVNLNNKEGLERTAQSVINQDCNDYEWIVIDGGSTDGSKEVIKKYKEYISYWISEPDKGIYNAMNKGLKVVKGDYIQFLNSGDCLFDNRVLSKLKESNIDKDIIYGYRAFSSNGKILDEKIPKISINKFSYFFLHPICQQTLFISRSCFENFNFNESYRYAADIEHVMKLILAGYTLGRIDEVVVIYDINGISTDNPNVQNEFKLIRGSVFPTLIKNDYDDLFKLRENDLGRILLKIINSNKFYRNLTRLFLYPISWCIKTH